MSGNAGKNRSSSTLTLTFTEDTHLSFEYKVSSEAKYDKCTITLGSNTLVDGVSGDQNWKGLELDAKRGDKLTVRYEKDSSGDKFDDCVYLRNFSAGEALVVTFHANNGTEDTATQKIFGGKGTLKANTFTCEGKIFAGGPPPPAGLWSMRTAPPSPRRRIWICTPCGRTLTPSRSATATPTPPFWSPEQRHRQPYSRRPHQEGLYLRGLVQRRGEADGGDGDLRRRHLHRQVEPHYLHHRLQRR